MTFEIKRSEINVMKKIHEILDNTKDDIQILFEKGEYHFREDFYREWFYCLTSHIGDLNMAFWLNGRKNVTIDGGGSEFIFHGRVTPFMLKDCSDVVLKNFTIDYDRPFYSQAEILGVNGSEMRLKIEKNFPYRVEGDNLIFYAENWENRLDKCITMLQEFDVNTKAPAYTSDTILCRIGDDVAVSEDAPLAMKLFKVRDEGNGEITLYGNMSFGFKPGNKLVFCHEDRINNAIYVYGCDQVTLKDIFIRHSSAFGIMGVITNDLTIENVSTALDERSKGLVSTNADSVHIIHCTGDLIIRDCVFENMLDDAVNVHGQFHEIVEITDKNRIKVRCKLWGYNGIETYRVGKKININRHGSTYKLGELTVKNVEYLADNDYSDVLLTVEEDVSEELLHCVVENYEMMPTLLIQRVKTGRNRPRGFLIQTNRPVIVEDCEFYNSNFAINITSDCTYWYESGPVKDVVIRRNKFINCNYSWGEAPIGITPEYTPCEEAKYYHKNIRITDNEIHSFTGGMIYAVGVDGLYAWNNKFILTDAYPKRGDTKKYTLRNCDNCDLE